MLRIEQVKSYKLPRYPQGVYYVRPDTRSWQTAGSIATAAILALSVSSCKKPGGDIEPSPSSTAVRSVQSSGVVGPPPVPTTMVTEREARTAIDAVFARNGIRLEADVPVSFSINYLNSYKPNTVEGEYIPANDSNSISLELDGFNKDLNIGYEYRIDKDNDTFTFKVEYSLDQASKSNDKTPRIKIIGPISYAPMLSETAEQACKRIETYVQDFINDLRSRGIIP